MKECKNTWNVKIHRFEEQYVVFFFFLSIRKSKKKWYEIINDMDIILMWKLLIECFPYNRTLEIKFSTGRVVNNAHW